MRRLNKKENIGITLVALIITIIVLLIIAAVTINIVIGENGLFNKTKSSVEKYKQASAMEETTLALAEVQMEMLTDKSVNATSMADYIKQKGGVAVGKGQMYEEGGEYFYESDDGVIVQMSVNKGSLKGYKVVEKPENENTGRVMYYANGGKGSTPNSSRVAYGETVTVDTEIKPTRDGYIFLGWALTNDATEAITEFTMPEKNVTLYAVWQKVITIIYNANGGTGTMEPTKVVNEPKVADNGFTAPNGKGFIGWNTKVDGTGTNYKKGDTVNDDITLYAQWGLPLGTEITFGGEKFFIIGYERDDVEILSKYNLAKTTNSEGKYYQQNKARSQATCCAFAVSYYWSSIWKYGIRLDMNKEDIYGHEEESAVDKAKKYGTSKGVKGRLMTYEEATGLRDGGNSLLINILYGKNYTEGQTTNNYLSYWLSGVSESDKTYAYAVERKRATYTNSVVLYGIRGIIV